jgi:hypothetical protein
VLAINTDFFVRKANVSYRKLIKKITFAAANRSIAVSQEREESPGKAEYHAS